MLTVMTWLWSQPGGRTSYTAHHVNIWAAMVRRHLTLPHRLACITNTPEGIDSAVEIIQPPGEFEGVRIPTWKEGRPSCFRRLVMFKPDAADLFGDRFVSMDLDCAIGGSLDPLFDRPDDIILFKGSQHYQPYNGSMLLMTAGARPHVYTKFTPERAAEAGRRYIGSDQSWLCYSLGPHETIWNENDGVWRFGGEYMRSGDNVRLLFFPGKQKPWSSGIRDEFTRRNYRLNLREPIPDEMVDRRYDTEGAKGSISPARRHFMARNRIRHRR